MKRSAAACLEERLGRALDLPEHDACDDDARHPQEGPAVARGRDADDPATVDDVPREDHEEHEREVGMPVHEAGAGDGDRPRPDPGDARDEHGQEQHDHDDEHDARLVEAGPATDRMEDDRPLREEGRCRTHRCQKSAS